MSPFKYNKVGLQSQRWEVIVVIEIHLWLLCFLFLVDLLSSSARWLTVWISRSFVMLVIVAITIIEFRGFFLPLITHGFSFVVIWFLSFASAIVLRFVTFMSFFFECINFLVVIIFIIVAFFSSPFTFQLFVHFFFNLLIDFFTFFFKNLLSFLCVFDFFLFKFLNFFIKAFRSKWRTQYEKTEHLHLIEVYLKSI